MDIIKAEWKAPPQVHAFTTTIQGGASQALYQYNNLALHVGDCSASVLSNRQQLTKTYLPSNPLWLEQTHSTRVVNVDSGHDRNADASFSTSVNTVLAILTADCLPIILTNAKGTEIAAIHAGWRGLLDGVIENTIQAMNSPPSTLMAWIGPHICGQCFEIGNDVLSLFTRHYWVNPGMINERPNHKYCFNLALLATEIMRHQGLNNIFNSHYCTFEGANSFYSYRRSGITGRIATLIWLSE